MKAELIIDICTKAIKKSKEHTIIKLIAYKGLKPYVWKTYERASRYYWSVGYNGTYDSLKHSNVLEAIKRDVSPTCDFAIDIIESNR